MQVHLSLKAFSIQVCVLSSDLKRPSVSAKFSDRGRRFKRADAALTKLLSPSVVRSKDSLRFNWCHHILGIDRYIDRCLFSIFTIHKQYIHNLKIHNIRKWTVTREAHGAYWAGNLWTGDRHDLVVPLGTLVYFHTMLDKSIQVFCIQSY